MNLSKANAIGSPLGDQRNSDKIKGRHGNTRESSNEYEFSRRGTEVALFGFNSLLIYIKGAPSTTYTITYDANGATSGKVPTDGKQYRANELVTVKGNTGNLARNGWNFRGWADTQAATTAGYPAGNTFKITKSLTLYAVWEGRSYTISFDKNDTGAGGIQASLSANFGTPVTLPAATTFTPRLGWDSWDGLKLLGERR